MKVRVYEKISMQLGQVEHRVTDARQVIWDDRCIKFTCFLIDPKSTPLPCSLQMTVITVVFKQQIRCDFLSIRNNSLIEQWLGFFMGNLQVWHILNRTLYSPPLCNKNDPLVMQNGQVLRRLCSKTKSGGKKIQIWPIVPSFFLPKLQVECMKNLIQYLY
jgi:hypothetical protein